MPNSGTNSLLQTAVDKFNRFWQPKASINMLHLGRCGSTVLSKLLDQHPKIYWDGEVFRRIFARRLWETHLIKDPFLLLRARMLYARKRYYGFETKCHSAYHLSKSMLNTTPINYMTSLKELNKKNLEKNIELLLPYGS